MNLSFYEQFYDNDEYGCPNNKSIAIYEACVMEIYEIPGRTYDRVKHFAKLRVLVGQSHETIQSLIAKHNIKSDVMNERVFKTIFDARKV